MSNLLKDYTTLSIGGPAQEIIPANTEEQLINTLQAAIVKNSNFLVIGGGSNLLVSDEGYTGFIIKNETKGIHTFRNSVIVKSGVSLLDLIDYANDQGLGGLENLAGIPGTVGGAIYGNAGAYGQTISDHLIQVAVFDTGSQTRKVIKRDDCEFSYRDSAFKRNGQIILETTFDLSPADKEALIKTSAETIKKREVKYPPGIKCPGSFFKNIIASELAPEILARIPEDKIVYGKVPAGTLLEMVGAKGDSLGQIEVAPYHANLFINKGEGTALDFYSLAKKYFDKVYDKFGIKLEPEVQLINLPGLQ